MGTGGPAMVGGQQNGVVSGAPEGERSLAGLALESCLGETPSSHAFCRRSRELPIGVARPRPFWNRIEACFAGRSIEGLPARTPFSRADPALPDDSGDNTDAMGTGTEAGILDTQSAVRARTPRDKGRDRHLEATGCIGR